jgi:hypothetical protein
MGFEPAAFGLLAGKSGKEVLENAIGNTSIAGKLYMDDKKKREEEDAKAEAAKAEAGTQAKAGEGMKKGGAVKKKMADGGKVPQDIDGASATRSPKKGEKPVYEEPGSGIRVDGKPLNKAKGGMIGSSASRRADGMASRGKTRGKMC